MWWLENTEEYRSQSEWMGRPPLPPPHASNTSRRPAPTRRFTNRTSSNALRSRFARLDLTPAQRAANALLRERTGSDPSEHDQLRHDICQLERLVRKLQSQLTGEAAERVRLRRECDRWLAETMELSQRLHDVDEEKSQLTRLHEIARAELAGVRDELTRERESSRKPTGDVVDLVSAKLAKPASTALIVRPKAA